MNKNFFADLKKYSNILIVSLCFVFILSLFIITFNYNSTENKAKRNLKHLSSKLTEINLTLADGTKDLTIDTTISKEVLSNCLYNLNNLLLQVSDIEETSEDIESIKDDLLNSLNSTILLYEKNFSLLSDTQTIKSIDPLDEFDSLKESCISNYSKLEENNIQLTFPDETITYFDNFYNYINTLIKINITSDFKNSQIRDFIYKLEGFNKDISYLNEDLYIAINKIREDDRSLEVIIDDIYNKEDIYNNLKEDIQLISIPEGCMEVYESLTEYINSYYPYLKSIKEAVIYEKTSINIDEVSDKIEEIYETSILKRNYVLETYNIYEKKLKEF